MIIVTGMDNTGKTTLVQELSLQLNIPTVKSPGPELSVNEKKLWVMDQLAREDTVPSGIVYDRFMPFEEMVYGLVLRGETPFTLNDSLLAELKNRRPVIIYTRIPREKILEFGDRYQMDGVEDAAEKLLAQWDELMMNLMTTGWSVIIYNYTQGPINIDQLMAIVEANDEACLMEGE